MKDRLLHHQGLCVFEKMTAKRDTIFALATPAGKSALATIRISGSKALDVIKKISSNVPTKSNISTLNNIITKLREYDIHVIIFVPPVHKYHIEHLSDNQQKYFSNVLETISNDSEIHIYSLYDYYREMDVWYDFIHVTSSPDFLNYSNDISDIFLKELSP